MAHGRGEVDNLTPKKTGRTTTYEPEDAREKFIASLERFGNVTAACKAARVSRQTAYNWRDELPEFKAAWDGALKDAVGVLEREAFRRAVTGTNKPVYQSGTKVGTIREYSDTLLIFLLKGAAPEKYRENVQVNAKHEHSGPNGSPIALQFNADAVLARIAGGSEADS